MSRLLRAIGDRLAAYLLAPRPRGAMVATVAPDLLQAELRPGDVLMACSDGVWHYFQDQELAGILDSLTPREATEFLIEKARIRSRGAGDNLSVVVVKIEPLESAPAAAAKPALN